jgi:hypothetical protein
VLNLMVGDEEFADRATGVGGSAARKPDHDRDDQRRESKQRDPRANIGSKAARYGGHPVLVCAPGARQASSLQRVRGGERIGKHAGSS